MAGGSKASIPSDVRKTIQNIKEVASNHTDDEIYAMLQECSMDPDETAQKLLYQDTFHEVKRKRDKRRENQSVNSKEPNDSRWRAGMQSRGGGRGGRGGYTSRYISHDANVGRNVYAGKENGLNSEKGITLVPGSQETENKTTTLVSSHMTGKAGGPCDEGHGSSKHGQGSQALGGSGIPTTEGSTAAGVGKTGSAPTPAADLKSAPATVTTTSEPVGQVAPTADRFLPTTTSPSVSGVYSSASDPVLVPSLDTCIPGIVGTIEREVGSQWAAVESTVMVTPESKALSQEFPTHPKINKSLSHDVAVSERSLTLNEKAASESRNSFIQGKISNKSQGVERNQVVDVSQSASSTSRPGSSSSRPSSNYGNRSQQVIGPQKIGPSKEWKPKQMNPNISQSSFEVQPVAEEVSGQSPPASSAAGSDIAASKLQKKFEDIRLSDSHVIIPNHLHVPEAERCGLSFGSFDASFGLNSSFENGPDTDKCSTPLSESSEEIEESTEEPSSSNQITSSTIQGDYSEQPPSPNHMPENLTAAEADSPAGVPPMPDYDQSKPETVSSPGGPQYSVVHTSPSYPTLSVIPPMLGSQFPAFESSEPQARDASRIPGFVVQQSFDPSTSYYTQIYRPGADGDGRFSPFLSPGAATKYNGNIAVLSPQTGQSQESGNSLVLSTAGPTLVTQAAGVMQSTIAVTQQPVPVFRQPAGVHLSHYSPANYLPYGQYIPPPFYLQTPTIHHFLSNTAFPQAGNIFPPPGAAAAAASTTVKYSLSPYKPGANTGNSPHVGMPGGYGPYGSTPTGYSPTPASTTGNSTGNEDLSAPQYKENNVFMTRQQVEGSPVWVPTPGRDISSLQAGSFYNLPQGQHVAFPAQAGHSAFAGIYHPAQTVAAATVHPLLQQPQTMAGAVEMVGAPANVYQQPQQSTVNWANNY